jgi:hypothetical protein
MSATDPVDLLAVTEYKQLALPHVDLLELTEAQRRELPPIYHRPYFNGLGKPHTWICEVCWGDGVTQMWPCSVALENGVEVARSLGLGYSW